MFSIQINITLDDELRVEVGILKMHRGGGGGDKIVRHGMDDPFNEKFSKQSVLNIPTIDQMCAARAIAVAYSRVMKNANYSNIRNPKKALQKNEALELLAAVNLPNNRSIELAELCKFEEYLDIQIIVYNKPLSDGMIYAGLMEKETKFFLYYSEFEDKNGGHFDVITKMAGFFASKFYCKHCLLPYNNRSSHHCFMVCGTCNSDECAVEQPLTCKLCQQECRSMTCYIKHLTPRLHGHNKTPIASMCASFWRCEKCSHLEKSEDKTDHKCWQGQRCKQCSKLLEKSGKHLCYMRATRPQQISGKFIYFDFEARVEDVFTCEGGYKMQQQPDQVCGECDRAGEKCTSCKICVNCKLPNCAQKRHIANYVISHSVCNTCVDQPLNSNSRCNDCGSRCYFCSKFDKKKNIYERDPCPDTCGKREVVFKGDDTAAQFSSWLCAPTHKGCTVIAHNGKAYDHHFILNYILNKTHSKVSCIYAGSKILCLKIPEYKMTLIDSISFLPMALSKIPKCFGLSTSKGTFPHLFNTLENWDYVGSLPDIAYYNVDAMSPAARQNLITWHNSRKGSIFDFQKEMYAYCREDVNILRLSCTAFRKMVLELTASSVEKDSTGHTIYVGGVDPFATVTMASLCLEIFRSKFLTEEWSSSYEEEENTSETPPEPPLERPPLEVSPVEGSPVERPPVEGSKEKKPSKFIKSQIGLIPNGGYSCKDTFSKKSLIWLAYLERSTNVKIQHALQNGGEFKIPSTNFRADGWCEATHTVYSYYGCYYHGCPEHTVKIDGFILRRSAKQLYAMTVDRSVKIKNLGYNHVEMWECKFDKKLKNLPPEEKSYLEGLEFVERLDARAALRGGRTNAIKLYCKVEGGQKILYFDVNSLYPSRMKLCEFFLDHPEIITSDFKDISEYFGVALVIVAPPRRLYHPTLPYSSDENGRLKFPLCRTCAEKESLTPCLCSDSERAFIGTYMTVELQEAVRQGYKIVKIYEVYHYSETTWDLFSKYINTFLKVKAEASGYPPGCESEEARQTYVDRYLEKEGVALNRENIKMNPGMRLVGKAALNCLWGRLAKRSNLRKTIFCKTPEDFFKIVNNKLYTLYDFHIVNDETVSLEYEIKRELVNEDKTTNVILASLVTAYGRLKLYEYLKILGDAVLYFDTDSIIFLYDPEKPHINLELGEFLGDLTDECPPGVHITDFCSSGAKSYAMKLSDGSEICKVKGFTLNYKNSLAINFDVMKDMVLKQNIQCDNNLIKIPIVNETKINRDKKKNVIYNRKEIKMFRAVYTKRVIQPDLSTLPYGY